MSTNAPSGPDPVADATKPLEDAAKALGVLYTHCTTVDPSGESCEILGEMLKGLGAVKQRIIEGPPEPPPMGPAPNSDPSAMDQAGMAMMGEMQQGPPPPPQGY